MAGHNVADHLLRRLREWGVDTVFGYAGDGVNGLLAAWDRAQDQPRFVQARHEEMAAFEAVGYAKLTGRLGVCAATSGPGAIHLLNGRLRPTLPGHGLTLLADVAAHYQTCPTQHREMTTASGVAGRARPPAPFDTRRSA